MGNNFDDKKSIFSSLPDEKLWKLIQKGELKGLEILFRRYHDDLLYYAFKLCNNKTEAEDFVQETFLKIWNQHELTENVRSVKPYLLIVLRNKVYNKYRSERAQSEFLYEDQQIEAMQFSHEEFMISEQKRKEDKINLAEALNRLPAHQREVICLKFYEGMSYLEIQEILSLEYQTVRNYIHEGLKQLRSILENHSTTLLLTAMAYLLSLLLLFL